MFPTSALKCFPQKNFLYFFLNKPALEDVLIFSQKNLIFQELGLFSGKSLSYISRKVPTPKKSLLFREIELSSTKLKILARPKKTISYILGSLLTFFVGRTSRTA